ncbi:MAG: Ig-like domain-containing protein, partial [Lachnospiraceae bacterium]|nr:Ig-like domain-containing protein [Lachnospiraceae bacterium]
YEEQAEYDIEEYEDQQEYEEEEYGEQEEYDVEENEEQEEYEEPQDCNETEEESGELSEYAHAEEYKLAEDVSEADKSQYHTMKINVDIYQPDDYAKDIENFYENAISDDYEEEPEYCEFGEYFDEEDSYEMYYDDESLEGEYFDEEFFDEEYYNEEDPDGEYIEADIDVDYEEDFFETAYGDYDADYEDDAAIYEDDETEELIDFWQRVKMRLSHLTAFDAVLASTGVFVLVAGFVILSMFLQSRQLNKQIEALAPIGSELKDVGVVGDNGLLAMADAAAMGNFAQDSEEQSTEETSSIEVVEPTSDKVNVDFVSVERDLKIRFTDVNTGELITGTVFEVTLTNAKGKQLILRDDDMDGIIYAQNVNAGVFDAIVTSTDKYKFPSVAQQVTVKDKVEYVVINVQDEVKTEKQIDVAVEDTEKNEATVDEEVLKDTVEWVESTKTPVSGSESYILVDKNTIADPSQTSMAAARMLFDTLNVSIDLSSATLSIGSSIDLKGTEFSDSKEGDVEYQYTTEWKSSDDKVASVSGGKVTANAAGTAVITYTVTRKTITTTTVDPIEETTEITVEKYEELSETEKGKCTPIKSTDGTDQIIGYTYTKVTEQGPENKTSETTESASAQCTVTVEAAKITSGKLELSKSADSCAVGASLTVKPAKLEYTKQDGSTETITGNFPSITWESSDKAIATVGADGVVTGVKAGKANITGKVTGIKGADGSELDIRCSVEITVTAAAELAVSLDRTSDVYIAVGGSTTLVATVANYKSDAGVTWETSDKKVATVDEKGVVTGVAAGSVKITATTKEKDAQGGQKQATCVVTVNSNAASDTTTKLKDKNGNQIYVKNSDGSYKEAVYADYFNYSEFYIAVQSNYVYTGWQTIDGKTYYYDKNGNVVTGTQIIQGVTYNFGSDGAIATSVNGSTFGIDVSRHNGTIDWNAVKASGVDYVIIRCGYRGSSTGVLIEDQNFKTNIKGATEAGLKVGVYVFSQAVNEVEAVKEASLAVSLVKGYNLTYPIFIDTESSGGRADKIDKATRTAVVNAFCQTVASAGYKPGIYASKTWFEDKLNMGAIGSYKIWLAQYSATPTYKGRYDMWQYSSKGKISGINTDVDLNYSYLGY